MANDHKLNDLKHLFILWFIILQFRSQMSNMGLTELKSRHQQCCVPLWKLCGESVPLPFLASRDCLHFWCITVEMQGPCLHVQRQQQ